MALMIDSSSSYGGGEGMLLSLDSHKSVPAPFLTKTYQLVDDSSTDHIVSWGEDDATFVVWRPPEFARDLLPNYFKHNNFSSFVRQLNTYGFRKIVPDRWEFANEFFKKGEKHLLCEIHRRKTAQPTQLSVNNHHQYSQLGHVINNSGGFFPFPRGGGRSHSASDESFDEFPNWCVDDSPPPLVNSSPPSKGGGYCGNVGTTTETALSEDNERLRRTNTMLMSELNHMRKLYNDIIYFVQNHVKPVAPSNASSYSSSASGSPLLLCNPSPNNKAQNNGHVFGYPKQHQQPQPMAARVMMMNNNNDNVHVSRTTPIVETNKTKLFGVPLLHSKKRLHPDQYNNNSYNGNMDSSKTRLVNLESDYHDLGLHLMPPSSTY